MRIAFMGADNIALPALRRLMLTSNVVGVVTQPDRPVGRHQIMTPPALKVLAEQGEIPVLQPESLKDEAAAAQIGQWKPDLIVVMAYGQILPSSIIGMAPCGCINVHASLLPRHRGASCIASAIRSGDTETGITIIDVVSKLDAGSMIKSSSFRLMGKETAGLLNHALAELAPNVLMDAIHDIASGKVTRVLQDESLVTYAPKLSRQNGLIDWKEDALEIERMIRAYDPWPGTYTVFRDKTGRPKRLKIFPFADCKSKTKGVPGEILSINENGIVDACGKGSLVVRQVQPEGGRKMPVSSFAAGLNAEIGTFESSLEK